ncbi:polysaccharide export protein (plasmid) [Megalodesulfovibrio gigas DSM 1382 = ATCC 19364]|uniref:Polysaccharide export protein n=1 Tax=Megalodesulfovibrio gigas (strain ATCC 19364 / DSM 1382 / NCIMB 9332 / VKM B-1759) TaxID=1121448 RepID=T2GGC3_MEGG1|nr:polysaccharide export protein [Megalodesulfovibrio gigas DSM 1382 = ATCC 19364]
MRGFGSRSMLFNILTVLSVSVLFSGCASFLPSSGPTRSTIDKYDSSANASGVQLIEVTQSVARRLLENQQRFLFSSIFTECPKGGQYIGPGDVVQVSVWETPPGALFSVVDSVSGVSSATPMLFPEQQVNNDGVISVPFAGRIPVSGLSLTQVEQEIYNRLNGKANEPQVMVRLVKNTSSTVTVVGEVSTSRVVPLTPKCERLLDVLAEAGGVKHPVGKLMLQLTRAGKVHSVPLEIVIKDQSENLIVEPGDVVTVLHRPNSFMVLGAAGSNDEVEFEATGITLTQALARAGGVNPNQADAKGVFLFRFEPLDALDWPEPPTVVTPENTVPVVFKMDLTDPATFFAAQSFPIKDKDVIFVSTAPSVQLAKFLNLIASVTSPALSSTSQVRTLTRSGSWD